MMKFEWWSDKFIFKNSVEAYLFVLRLYTIQTRVVYTLNTSLCIILYEKIHSQIIIDWIKK